MKTFLILLLSITFSTFTFAQFHQHSAKVHNHKLAIELDKVLEANQELFSTLLKNDQSQLEIASNKLREVIAKSSSKEIKALNLGNMAKAKNKSQNIEIYGQFLPKLIEVFKQNNINQNYAIYYCPMVKKYWIQNIKIQSKVQNVFAQDMLECGEKI
ncbi:MAG: hypothetical protein JNM93_04010 [Bacteriovoracaceae bacterium]|nr:hypothetical protein [Bacteriovoracaceae bacterium]